MRLEDVYVPVYEVDLTLDDTEPVVETVPHIKVSDAGVVTIVDADKALERVRARIKPEILDQWRNSGSMLEHVYQGHRICCSKLTGKWWVTTEDGIFMGYANDYVDGRMIVDQAVARAK